LRTAPSPRPRAASLQGDVRGAIEQYHSALALRPDDPFTSEMLSTALQEAALAD
jgi:hypothetical protein